MVVHAEPSGERSNLTVETPARASDTFALRVLTAPCTNARLAGAVSEPVGGVWSNVTRTPSDSVAATTPSLAST